MKILVISLLFWTSTSAHASEIIGKVLSARGSASAKEGSEVQNNQKLTTGNDGVLQIGLYAPGSRQGPFDSVMRIGPGSDVRVEEPQSKGYSLWVSAGKLLSTVRKLSKPHYEVRTRDASMGVRGTTFFVQKSPSHPTFLCVCEGSVETNWSDGKEKVVIHSKHHDAPKWIGSTIEPAPMGIEHTDAQIEELQRLLK